MFAKLSAEFIGTFWLVLGGCGSAVLAAAFPEVGIGLTGIVACSSGTSSPPATTPTAASSAVPTSAAPTSAALCSAAADFRTATDAIGNLDANQVGVDGVKAAPAEPRNRG